jgi:hypothetical protein
MAYPLIISKRRFWADRSGRVIEEHQWQEIVDQFSTIGWQDYNTLALFTKREFRKHWHAFRWQEGRVWVIDSDAAIQRMALTLASAMGASLQGALGEHFYFDDDGDVRYIWPDLGLPDPWVYQLRVERRRKWLQYIILPLVIMVGICLGVGIEMNKSGRQATTRPSRIEKEQRERESWTKMREAVQRGEATKGATILMPEDHAIYLKRAQAGDPDVRPLDKDVFEYLAEKYGSRSKDAAKPGGKPEPESVP